MSRSWKAIWIAFDAEYQYQEGPDASFWIVMHPRTRFPELAFLHEVGRFLDHQGFGNRGDFSSSADELFRQWRNAVYATDSVEVLRGLSERAPLQDVRSQAMHHLAYPELWARSYSQFIAEASGDSVLLTQIQAVLLQTSGPRRLPLYWSRSDFHLVAEAIDRVLRNQGWRTR